MDENVIVPCDICGKDGVMRPDPYVWELYDDDTEIPLRDDCARDRAYEV